MLIAALLFAAPVQGQQKEGLTAKVYQVKWQKAEDIAKLLIGMDVELVPNSMNASFNTFTVRASQQGHAAVAELIQKYDVRKKNVEFQFFLIKATKTGEGLKDGLPSSVRSALYDVAKITRYTGFELIGTPFLRAQEGGPSQLTGNGYSIDLSPPSVITEQNKNQIRIGRLSIFIGSGRSGTVTTAFSRNDGEVVVIGASGPDGGQEGKDSGSAIISVVTAKVL